MITLRQFHTRKLQVLLVVASLLALPSVFAPVQRARAKELIGAVSPVWSPNGAQIAYTIYKGEQADLYVIDVEGASPVKLADNASQPKWSPDGKRIAYTGYTSDTTTVNIIDVSSRAVTKLTMGYYANWSPDGKQLAYLAGEGLFIANSDGSTPRRMITDRSLRVWDTAWSPDGSRIALKRQGKTDDSYILSVINPDGSGLHDIGASAYELSFSWSSDGSQLIFVGDCGGQANNNICIVNADGSKLRALIPYRGALQPVWSPDGKQILFTNSNLYLVNVDGTNQRQLTGQKTLTNDSDASWSPDGKQILFTRMHYPSTTSGEPYVVYYEVYMMNADGSNMRRLPDGLGTF